MTDGMEIDISELITESERLPKLAEEARAKLRPVVSKGANNIKRQQQAEARESPHFRKLASAITYDLTANQSVIEAEIGPEKGGAGSIAVIAYFGGSGWAKPTVRKTGSRQGKPGWPSAPGGGGTLPDPEIALKAEAPKFEQAVGDVIGEVFGG